MNELKAAQKSVSQEGKEKKKAEKMAAMMAGLDQVSFFLLSSFSTTLFFNSIHPTRTASQKKKQK